jgi:ribosomal protein S18 acetylase RimI-like enzyme
MEIGIVTGEEAIASGLAERIVELDRRNMQPVMEAAGIPFPEEKRRRGLEGGATLIVASDGGVLAGYLQFQPSWRDPERIYIASIQVEPRHRGGRLMLRLLAELRRLLELRHFSGFETGVQKANTAAVEMYRKIGFSLQENPENHASWIALADHDLLTRSPILPLLDRYASTEDR